MKRLSTFAFTLLLASTLCFAQAGGGTGGDKGKTSTADQGKKGHKGGKKSHKGGKKSKKGSGSDIPPPPK